MDREYIVTSSDGNSYYYLGKGFFNTASYIRCCGSSVVERELILAIQQDFDDYIKKPQPSFEDLGKIVDGIVSLGRDLIVTW